MRVAGGFWWQLSYSFAVSMLVGLYHHHFPFQVRYSNSELACMYRYANSALYAFAPNAHLIWVLANSRQVVELYAFV